MHILLFFVDGLGLGNNTEDNPLTTANMTYIKSLLGGQPLTADTAPFYSDKAILISVDANLGIPGLPQSATGQTALFTGVNAAKAIGRHFPAFPTPSLREIIAEYSILKQVIKAGGKATSANAYSPNYFELVAQGKRRHSASTLAILAGDIPLRRDLDILINGCSVSQDITNEALRAAGFPVPLINPLSAGRNLAGIVKDHHFTLFEYFQTDILGHRQKRPKAEAALENIDLFFRGLIEETDLSNTLIILTSDHGNIEDLSVKTHTYNSVPALLLGKSMKEAAASIRSIVDVAPVIRELSDRFD